MKIVSANYNNRDSDYKWLVRDENEPAQKAVACKAVNATGVSFITSPDYEQGFGCSMVARCETAEMIDPEPRGEPLKFNGLDFNDEYGRRVTECETLTLLPTGKMNFTRVEEKGVGARARIPDALAVEGY